MDWVNELLKNCTNWWVNRTNCCLGATYDFDPKEDLICISNAHSALELSFPFYAEKCQEKTAADCDRKPSFSYRNLGEVYNAIPCKCISLFELR